MRSYIVATENFSISVLNDILYSHGLSLSKQVKVIEPFINFLEITSEEHGRIVI